MMRPHVNEADGLHNTSRWAGALEKTLMGRTGRKEKRGVGER
jgi:hypothetical protein